jgi:hypothetical protein
MLSVHFVYLLLDQNVRFIDDFVYSWQNYDTELVVKENKNNIKFKLKVATHVIHKILSSNPMIHKNHKTTFE